MVKDWLLSSLRKESVKENVYVSNFFKKMVENTLKEGDVVDEGQPWFQYETCWVWVTFVQTKQRYQVYNW